MKNKITTAFLTIALWLVHCAAHADEADCLAGLEKAAGQYASCESRTLATSLAGSSINVDAEFAKCRAKYAAVWVKLQSRNPGTSCDAPRFVDNGNDTVTDHLTGLVWEKKTTDAGSGPNPSDWHDVDNFYSWTNADADQTDGDGTVFTDFLAGLNSGEGFAGANDWRLPTIRELQTILLPDTYPCATWHCAVAELGPDAASGYWSTSTDASLPTNARVACTYDSGVETSLKRLDNFVRAVRSGS